MTNTALPRATDTLPDATSELRDLGEWLQTLSGALDRMHPRQRGELLRAARGLRRDLAAINIPVPGATR